MENGRVLEITVDSLERALAAERGGAHRIELCADLSAGGLTPASKLMSEVRELVRIPIVVLVRPRGGDFVYSDKERAVMGRDIQTARELGMDGVVLGILRVDGHVDVSRTRALVERARPLPVTFHRAFDVSTDLRRSLEEVIQTGAVRILSSGGALTAVEGLACLSDLVKGTRERISIMPGSGVTAANIRRLVEATGAREFHAGLSSVSVGLGPNAPEFEEEVRKLVRVLEVSGSSET